MFGAIKPKRCHLSREAAQDFEQMYCGSCAALGDHYGLLSRGTLSYDQVFLATLIEGLQETPSFKDKTRCPIAPWMHRPTIETESPAMRISSAFHILLVDQWLLDQQLDRQWLWGWARLLTRPLSRKAADEFRYDDDLLELITTISERQSALEKTGGDQLTPDEAAAPTAELLGLLLKQVVAPLNPSSSTPEQVGRLDHLGHALGSAIYLIDALEDLEQDQSRRLFNVCLRDEGGQQVRAGP